MNDSIKLFLMYAEHHDVVLTNTRDDVFAYCVNTDVFCAMCRIQGSIIKRAHNIRYKDVVFLKENYPELFV